MKRLFATLSTIATFTFSPPLHAETDKCLSSFKNQEHSKALQHCRIAANEGNPEAAWFMGQMASQGLGTDPDSQQAMHWFQMAANGGHADSQYNLGVMLDMGQGATEDNQTAVVWYKKAAAQNHIHAQHNLALMYANGEGVKQDYQEALKWTHKAAENGLAESQFLLGQMYRTGGELMPADAEKSLAWFTKAGEQDHLKSQLTLALAYAKGIGVEVQPDLAMDWSRRAAFLGSPRAQFLLGALHMRFGKDQQDLQESAAWLTVAVASGIDEAMEPLRHVTTLLTQDEFMEAQKSAQAIIKIVQRQRFQGAMDNGGI